ncbi:unnamed protein product [Gadus morhua 'NCC']
MSVCPPAVSLGLKTGGGPQPGAPPAPPLHLQGPIRALEFWSPPDRTSETWSGLQRPGPDFRDLVRASETWSGLQRPGPGFRDRVRWGDVVGPSIASEELSSA